MLSRRKTLFAGLATGLLTQAANAAQQPANWPDYPLKRSICGPAPRPARIADHATRSWARIPRPK